MRSSTLLNKVSDTSVPEIVLSDMESYKTVVDWVVGMLSRQTAFCPQNLTVTFPSTRVGVLLKDGKIDDFAKHNLRVLRTVMTDEYIVLPCDRINVYVDLETSSIDISWKKKKKKISGIVA